VFAAVNLARLLCMLAMAANPIPATALVFHQINSVAFVGLGLRMNKVAKSLPGYDFVTHLYSFFLLAMISRPSSSVKKYFLNPTSAIHL
jgi:hypothetical protein